MKHIKIATIISYITLFAGNIISLLYTPFMLATLGESEYGLFSLTNTIISYIYLLDMGFGNAVIRYNSQYIEKKDEEGRKSLNGMFIVLYSVLSLIGVLVGLIIYPNLGNWFSKGLTFNEVRRVQLMFIVAMVNLVLCFPLNVFNGIIISHEKFIYTKVISLIRTILNPFIMISVLLLGYKAIGMLIASSVFNILVGIVNIIYCLGILRVKFTFRNFNKKVFKEIFNFSFFILLSSIAYKIYWSTDQFILGMFVGSVSIAIYSIGSQMNNYFISFSNVLNGMFLPQLTKMTSSKNYSSKKVMGLLVRISRLQYFLATLILSGFILFGKQFIERWAGSGYEESYYIALLVMFPQLISIIQSLFAVLLEAMNRHRIKSFIYLAVSIFNLTLTLVLVKPYGGIGCALATMIGMFVNALLNNIYYSKILKLDMGYYWKSILKLLPSTLVALIIGKIMVSCVNPITYPQIGICGIIFTLVYGFLLWFLALNPYEKDLIRGAFYRIKRFS